MAPCHSLIGLFIRILCNIQHGWTQISSQWSQRSHSFYIVMEDEEVRILDFGESARGFMMRRNMKINRYRVFYTGTVQELWKLYFWISEKLLQRLQRLQGIDNWARARTKMDQWWIWIYFDCYHLNPEQCCECWLRDMYLVSRPPLNIYTYLSLPHPAAPSTR